MMVKIRKDSRQAQILAALEDDPALRVNQLAQKFGVTTETIRRDLAELAQAGRINRTYGGAVRLSNRFEPVLADRLKLMVPERSKIARHAVDLYAHGDALMLGGGATMLHFARALCKVQHRMIVITPSLLVAQELASNPQIEVMLLPGVLDPHEHVVNGSETLRAVEKFRAPVALIGASGVNTEGISEAMPSMGEVYMAMLANADHGIILADHSKFDKRALILMSGWNPRLSLITDRNPAPDLSTAIRNAGANIALAPSGGE
jgi:DeoR/GlpR family transcriptional regulator of sugar metabolism